MSIPFLERHIGTDSDAQATMLAAVGYSSVEELVTAAVPDAIRVAELSDSVIPPAVSERDALR